MEFPPGMLKRSASASRLASVSIQVSGRRLEFKSNNEVLLLNESQSVKFLINFGTNYCF